MSMLNGINYEIIETLKSIPDSVADERPTHHRPTQSLDYLGRAGTLEGSSPLQLEVPRCHHRLKVHSVSCDSVSQVKRKWCTHGEKVASISHLSCLMVVPRNKNEVGK